MNKQKNTVPPEPPFIWNIPYSRNLFFTGRKELFTRLALSLEAGHTTALTHPQAISGLGGIGKTQIAVEYGYRSRSNYQAVLWAQADTRLTLTSSYVTIAHLLNLPEKDAPNQGIAVKAVLEWMKSHTNWLLILDNSDDLNMVREFIPSTYGGHILLTTRASALGRLARRIEVEVMTPEDGAVFLLRRAALLAPGASLEQVGATDREIAYEIVQELGGLPLAIDQAGAYIEETGCSLSYYLDLYKARRSVLLERRGDSPDYQESVTTTWTISFKQVESTNPAAAAILRLCAFLHPDMIPEEILTEGAFHLGSELDALTQDQFAFNEAMRVLRAFSLVKRNTANRSLSIHRLVQAVLTDKMSMAEYNQWAERAVHAVNAVLPLVDIATWNQWERYLSNALNCISHIEQREITTPEALNLLDQTGWYLYERGLYVEAEQPLQLALKLRKDQLRAEHQDTTTSMNDLGLLYYAQGRYDEAERLYIQALTIREKIFGSEHPVIATSLTNLAWLYRARGQYEEARHLYTRALNIRKTCLGPEHPETAVSMTNLAWFYFIQGPYAEAEQLFVRALAIQKQQVGVDHPDTARIENNLGLLYLTQGKYEEAEALLLKALATRMLWYGQKHPAIATSLSNLAYLYQMQKRHEEAEALGSKALEIHLQLLGREHPETALSFMRIGSIYYASAKYEEAEAKLKQALEMLRKRVGLKHGSVAGCLTSLAMLYNAQGKYDEAEPLLLQALEIYEQISRKEHPETAAALHELARIYSAQKRYDEAEQLYVQVLEMQKRLLGTDHPSTQLMLEDFVALLRTLQRDAEVEQLEGRYQIRGLQHESQR